MLKIIISKNIIAAIFLAQKKLVNPYSNIGYPFLNLSKYRTQVDEAQ